MFVWDQSSRSHSTSKLQTRRRAFLRTHLQMNTCLLITYGKICRNHHDTISFRNDTYLYQRFELWWVLEILGTLVIAMLPKSNEYDSVGRGYSLEWFDWCACVLPWCVAKRAERHDGDAIDDVLELLHRLLTSDRWLAYATTSRPLLLLSRSRQFNKAGIIPFINSIMIHV